MTKGNGKPDATSQGRRPERIYATTSGTPPLSGAAAFANLLASLSTDGSVSEEIKAIHRTGGRTLTDTETVEFICRPVHILDGALPMEWSGRGRQPKKTRGEYSAELRRGMYHKLVRLPQVRAKAAATRRKSGDVSRDIVFGLCRELRQNGTPRRCFRKEVKRLATARGLRIPADWQLGKIITDFFKVDTTT